VGRRSRQGKSPREHVEFRAFAVIAPGLEEALADELLELGCEPELAAGGVYFSADLGRLYLVHCWSRLAGRITVELGQFRSTNPTHLGECLRRLDVSPFIWPNQPIDVRVVTRGSRLRHRESVSKKARVSLQDAARGPRVVTGRGRLVEARVQLRIVNDQVSVSVDASGELLHRRGWRKASAKAPIRENLGAAVLRLSGWAPGESLVDPMCGSGTFGIEAAQISLGVAPGTERSFAFEQWPVHDAKLWKRVQADARQRNPPQLASTTILLADRDAGAVKASTANARRAGVSGQLEVKRTLFAELIPPAGCGLVVANPPYGERIDVRRGQLYGHMGRVLCARWGGWRVALLVPDLRYVGGLGFSVEEKARFSNGGISVFLVTGVVPRG
jgi:putative N6-adenine-specific DNA methylase